MSKYEPFNFIAMKSKSMQLTEKVDNLFDSIQVVIVNLMRMESYYNDQFTKVSESMCQLSQRIDMVENQLNKPLLLPSLREITPNPVVIPPPPPKVIPNSTNLRGDILKELQELWKNKKLVDDEEEVST